MSVIIDINHEACNLNEWTAVVGDIFASASAALAGSGCGMSVPIDDDTDRYGDFQLGADDTSGVVRIRFYFDPNSLTMAEGTTQYIGLLRSAFNVANILMKWTAAAGFAIQAQFVGDLVTQSTSFFPITDASHFIEVKLVRATTAISSDGTLDLWIDDAHKQQLVGDNFHQFDFFRLARLGAPAGAELTTGGTYYVDEVIVNNDGSAIGMFGEAIEVNARARSTIVYIKEQPEILATVLNSYHIVDELGNHLVDELGNHIVAVVDETERTAVATARARSEYVRGQ